MNRTSYHRKYYHKRKRKRKLADILAENPHYKQYRKADKFITVNENDEVLQPIKIYLPESPDEKTIDGWGLPVSEQYFRIPEIPKKLIQLQKNCSTVKECVETIRKNPEFYKEEIDFIQREWERRLHGYWFYNNGKPTYITGAHYLYQCYWWLGAKHPEYRSRDRKFFLFAIMCLLDPYCAGFNYPKFRREGATSKTACFEYWLITQERNVDAGNQSKDEQSAAEIFLTHIMPSHKRMPFWFKPITRGKTEAQRELDFFPVGANITKEGSEINLEESLESSITYGSSTEGYYDGKKLRLHYSDECGKTLKANVYERHLVIKPSIMEGNKYIGMIINTSTVGEMLEGGGENFKELCKQSMYHERNENGETNSGLYNLFIPAYEGFDLIDKKTGKKFLDKFGETDEEEVKKYLSKSREDKLLKGDVAGYSEDVRMFPMKFSECFRIGVGKCKFNEQVLNDRIEEFRFGNPNIVRGNFMWKDGVRDTEVLWIPSESGKFLASYIPDVNMRNQVIIKDGKRTPALKHLGIAGGDPFKFNVVRGKKSEVSKGAGAYFLKFNPSIDDANADPKTWKSNKFGCTYCNRPKLNEYAEDMLMMCVFYGCEMYPEINVPLLWTYFEERGYGEYLYHKIDLKTKKKSKQVGGHTDTAIQETIFGEFSNYIDQYGKYEFHTEIFKDCIEIQDDMNPYDLFVAAGYALMGAKRQELIKPDVIEIKTFHRKYKYN